MPSPGLNLTQMRDLVRRGLGNLDETDLPNEDVDLYLNMAFWALEERFPFKEKECRTSFTTIDGTNMYLVPNEDDAVDLEAIQSMSVEDPKDGVTYPVYRMTQSWWDQVRVNDAVNESVRGRPERYVRMDESIILHPTPSLNGGSNWLIRIYFLKTLKSLLAGQVDEPDLPHAWHEIVVEGAIERAHLYNQDYNLSQQVNASVTGRIRSAVPIQSKEERDMHYAGLDVLHEAPDHDVLS